MKRFRRIAVNVTATISFLLLATDVGLWVRSYATADVVVRLSTDKPPHASTTRPAVPFLFRRTFAVASIRGRFQCGFTREAYSSFTLIPDGWNHAKVPTPLVARDAAPTGNLGFDYHHYAIPPPVVITEKGEPIQDPATTAPILETWTLWIPCWFLAILTAIDPAMWLWSRGWRSSATLVPTEGHAQNDRPKKNASRQP